MNPRGGGRRKGGDGGGGKDMQADGGRRAGAGRRGAMGSERRATRKRGSAREQLTVDACDERRGEVVRARATHAKAVGYLDDKIATRGAVGT